MFKRRRKYEKSSTGTVISTKTSHKAKGDEVQPRVMTHEHADAMLAPEHYASTPRTRALRSVISRMMSKCRTRQLESCGTLSAFFHDWLQRGVRAESPKDLRLRDGWCWHLVTALLLLGPGVSIQWLPGSAHMTTDGKYVENLAGLSEVRGLKPSSRVTGVGSMMCWSGQQLQRPWCSAEVRELPRVSDRAGLHTTRTAGWRSARTSLCPYASSTRRW